MSVRSCGRCVLLVAPTDLTWLKAAAYRALASSGGGPSRNWLGVRMPNGVTFFHWRNAPPAAAQPAVSCHNPGCEEDGRKNWEGAEPSFARAAIIAAAAA